MRILQDYRELGSTNEAPGVDMREVIGPGDHAAGFVMRVFEVAPGAATPAHTHEWEQQVYVISGRGVVRSQNKETRIMQGSVICVSPNEYHCFVNTSDSPLRFVEVVPNS